MTDKLNEIDKGTYREVRKITFKDFSSLWLRNYAEVNVKPSTLEGYQRIIKRLIPVFGDFNIDEITIVGLQSYISDRLRSVKAKSVSNEIVVIKEMFKHAYEWGYLKANPAECLKRPRVVRPEIEILDPREIQRLLSIEDHYRIAFKTAIMAGLRVGELWGLQWGDIDFQEASINLRRTLWKTQFLTPKSRYSIRRVDIPVDLLYDLKVWKMACPVNDYDLVFPSPEGSLTNHENAVKRHFYRALRKAGLRYVSFHSLRHSNASLRIASGQNIKYIQTQLGHASIKITMDTYGHLFNDVNFNRQQVGVFEDFLQSVNASQSGLPEQSVRNPLENPSQEVKKGLEISSNPLIYQLTVADEFRNSCFFSKQELDLDFEQIYQILG
ncbi:MAG: site-specific integrase [bacterium]